MTERDGGREEEKVIEEVNEAVGGCGGCTETWEALSEYRTKETKSSNGTDNGSISLDRRNIVQMVAATGLPLSGLPTISTADQSNSEIPESGDITVEKLDINKTNYYRNRTLRMDDARTLVAHFKDMGWQPSSEAKAVKSTSTETGYSVVTIQIPFNDRRKRSNTETSKTEEQVYLQRSIGPGTDPKLVGVHAVSIEDEPPYTQWEIINYKIKSDNIVEDQQQVDLANPYSSGDPDEPHISIFGCPRDKVNPKGLTKLAGDYAVAFASCATCAGSATVFVPACAACVGQIARMGASLDEYKWCECNPQTEC